MFANAFPQTILLRHRKENLKKCSLKGLEKRCDMSFYTYPWVKPQPDLSSYVVLSMEGPPLSSEDNDFGLFLIDATWRYTDKMHKSLQEPYYVRSLPTHFRTAYPRSQEDCIDPNRGLASIEALYIAYTILERDTSFLLDNYHWKDVFLKQNRVEPEITTYSG